ncbi:hypothetical protein Bpfe_003805, partial [Biomphalaria pfeifferi]
AGSIVTFLFTKCVGCVAEKQPTLLYQAPILLPVTIDELNIDMKPKGSTQGEEEEDKVVLQTLQSQGGLKPGTSEPSPPQSCDQMQVTFSD